MQLIKEQDQIKEVEEKIEFYYIENIIKEI
jgi:hypothetical protein